MVHDEIDDRFRRPSHHPTRRIEGGQSRNGRFPLVGGFVSFRNQTSSSSCRASVDESLETNFDDDIRKAFTIESKEINLNEEKRKRISETWEK